MKSEYDIAKLNPCPNPYSRHHSSTPCSIPQTLDTMSAEELNAKLQHSYEQALNGETLPFESVFSDLKRGLSE